MKRDLLALLSLLAVLCISTPSSGQQDPNKPPGFKPNVAVDQAGVDKAIEKGLIFLKTSDSPKHHVGDSDELKLLTFLEGGTPASDPVVQALVAKCSEAPLEKTYKVALLAMCLESLDRVKYQQKIAQCGQFLLDNIKPNGAFDYGEPTAFVNDVAYKMPAKEVASGGGKAKPVSLEGDSKEKPKVLNKIKLTKKKDGPAERSDNSNSQYAALGMRACFDAGIVFPKEWVEKCKQYWVSTQHPGEKGAAKDRPAIASGGNSVPVGDPRGWCYSDGQGSDCSHGGPPYSSMTAGAIGAVCIYDYILGKDWKKEKVVLDGMAWLDKNWSVKENLGPPETSKGDPHGWLYYYLYAIERTGMLYDTALIGNHDWYLDGARELLGAQKADGSWDASSYKHPTWDTCFAILFLKRATHRLVASTGK
ncbi:MAG TPA: hypothetical protein VE981_06040 [Planctomycetota bacterium]|nr:hypothetical protein [Planctomycetota bacterium]